MGSEVIPQERIRDVVSRIVGLALREKDPERLYRGVYEEISKLGVPLSAPPPERGFGTRLKLWREALSIPPEGLGVMMGVDVSTVTKWERHDMCPDPLYRGRLWGVISRTPEYVFSGNLEGLYLPTPRVRGKVPPGFGERVRRWREERGISRFELAKMLGVRRVSVEEWETRGRVPRRFLVRARILEVMGEDVLFGEGAGMYG